MRALHGLRPRVEPLESIVVPGEVERMFGPLPVDDLELLGQNRHPLTHRREREAVGGVLGLEPAGPDAELDAAAGDVVRRDHGLGQHARVAEGRGRDEGADAQRGRDRAQRRHGAPGIERAALGVLVDGEVVVGAEKRVEAEPFARLRERDPVGPRDALLAFDHEADPHRHSFPRSPAGTNGLQIEAPGAITRDVMSVREHGVGDSRLMGPVSGLLWITAGIAAAVVQPLTGTPSEHPLIAWGLIALILVYGVACVRGWLDWQKRTLRDHAIAIVAFQPLIALGLWVSGGADSYLGPILVLPTLYVAYFFPPRYAWPLAVIEIATYCSPFLYSDTDHSHLLLGRAVMYAAAYAGLVATIQYLKSHLVAAERRQRRMAHEDPLTGLPNRRAFDSALDAAVASGRPFSLLLIDVDRFKTINDTHGHTVGDEVLCAIALRPRAAIRSSDTLARIGGDELALVAPGAAGEGATRLALALHDAVATVRPVGGAAQGTPTISTATDPADGQHRAALLRAADHRLHAVKAMRPPVAVARSAGSLGA